MRYGWPYHVLRAMGQTLSEDRRFSFDLIAAVDAVASASSSFVDFWPVLLLPFPAATTMTAVPQQGHVSFELHTWQIRPPRPRPGALLLRSSLGAYNIKMGLIELAFAFVLVFIRLRQPAFFFYAQPGVNLQGTRAPTSRQGGGQRELEHASCKASCIANTPEEPVSCLARRKATPRVSLRNNERGGGTPYFGSLCRHTYCATRAARRATDQQHTITTVCRRRGTLVTALASAASAFSCSLAYQDMLMFWGGGSGHARTEDLRAGTQCVHRATAHGDITSSTTPLLFVTLCTVHIVHCSHTRSHEGAVAGRPGRCHSRVLLAPARVHPTTQASNTGLTVTCKTLSRQLAFTCVRHGAGSTQVLETLRWSQLADQPAGVGVAKLTHGV